MTDLTEQLYAGTLPTGHYYFNNGVETYIVLYKNINSKHLILQEPEGLTVISEVPSCEEWKKLKEFADYSIHNRDELTRQINFWMQENTKLKELLKECKQWFDWYHIDTGTGKEYIESWHKKGHEIHQKINQALGEDK